MSFSAEVKNELCRGSLNRPCCALAEAYGVLLYATVFSASDIRIITESTALAARLPRLFQRAFHLSFDVVPEEGSAGKKLFRITDPGKLAAIIDCLGFSPAQFSALHINLGLLEEECCRAAFLRGAFLTGGSVIDPRKQYHLELATSHQKVSREMETLLTEMGYQPRSVMRQGNQVIYFKQSKYIEELLTRMGARVSAMQIMTAKVEKEMTNQVNRQVNCETANVDKTVQAAQTQVAAIRRLAESGVLETLSQPLQEAAVARMYAPELTLSELAESFDPPISKSCLNHRMRKLIALAQEK